ncbi:MAG: glycoside hydrolase family 16 protein [Chloroflexi bacterium]|nr:glycoside hydrolase family 16 protein [Chloroflexota bacterium]
MGEELSPLGFPPNPLEKPGYVLEFHDEFDGPELDTRKWVPYYLPQWSSRAQSAPRYEIRQGQLRLQITRDQPPWCPEFDGEIRCSSIQTGLFAGLPGSPAGQHRFNPALVVREAQENAATYTPQYGYFETRVKAIKSSANHVAVWMIGYEDAPERSGEIAICEIMGDEIANETSKVGLGVHPWGDPALEDAFYRQPIGIDASRFHIYAVEWLPDRLDFYVDNVKVRSIDQSPNYPMQFMVSIYENPSKPDSGAPYPREFAIDYFCAYQPEGGYR